MYSVSFSVQAELIWLEFALNDRLL